MISKTWSRISEIIYYPNTGKWVAVVEDGTGGLFRVDMDNALYDLQYFMDVLINENPGAQIVADFIFQTPGDLTTARMGISAVIVP